MGSNHSYVEFLIIWVYLLDIYGIPLFWTIPIYSLNSIAISTFDLLEKSLSKGTPVWQSWWTLPCLRIQRIPSLINIPCAKIAKSLHRQMDPGLHVDALSSLSALVFERSRMTPSLEHPSRPSWTTGSGISCTISRCSPASNNDSKAYHI